MTDSPPLTPAELDVIEARANAATGGPWRVDRTESGAQIRVDYPLDRAGDRHRVANCGVGRKNDAQDNANSDFIAAARTGVPRLVAALREAWRRIEALEEREDDEWRD